MANAGAKSLTSDDINYLIYRYLQESGTRAAVLPAAPARTAENQLQLLTYCPPPPAGFNHSAFTFAHESHIHQIGIDPNKVAPGALVTCVQKGLQYIELEANLDVSKLTKAQ